MGETEANKTDADRIAAGPAAEIMQRGAEVPQVKPPQNILLATKSCLRISCLTTLATTTLPIFSVPLRVWQIICTPPTVQRLLTRFSRCKQSRSMSMTSHRSKRTLTPTYPYHSQAGKSTSGARNMQDIDKTLLGSR